MTGRLNRALLVQLRRKAEEALWQLDPAGIVSDREHIPNEYESLASGIAYRVEGGISFSDTTEWLVRELKDIWGLEISLADAERTVRSATAPD